jgi:hypothetical protein
MHGLCERTGEVGRWDYATYEKRKVVLEAERRRPNGDPRSITVQWTWSDAEDAGLTRKDNWRSYPAQMLRHRCDADAARALFPDVVSGLYTPDELGANYDPKRGEVVEVEAETTEAPERAPDGADEVYDVDPEPDVTDEQRALIERIRERIDEAYGDGVSQWSDALDAYLSEAYDGKIVDLSPDTLKELGHTIAGWSSHGGRRSKRRLELDRRLAAYNNYAPATPIDWSATASDDDDDRETLRKRWHEVAPDKLGGLFDDYRAALKSRHEADSFKSLTSAAIMDDLATLERLDEEAGEPGGMSPLDDHAMGMIEQYGG